VYPDGVTKCSKWYKHGVEHREGGPACIENNRHGFRTLELWKRNGLRHRLDGPACITDVCEQFYIYGYAILKKKYESMSDVIKYMSLIDNRDGAIMNIRHPSRFMRLRCQEILDGK
jgi:hypothetical protein